MPRSKRRGDRAPSDPSPGEFTADLRAESHRRAEELIQLTSAGGSATAAFPELHRVVSELAALQRDFTVTSRLYGGGPDRVEAAKRLVGDLEARGVDCSAVTVADFERQGLGLKANRALQKLDVVLKIPRSCILTADEAYTSVIGDFLRADPVCAGMASMALAMFLLHEACRGAESPWAAYIAALPATFTNCLYFSPHDLRLLKGSPVQERVAADFRRICRQYAFFLLQLGRGRDAQSLSFRGRFTFDDFRWAVAAVMSRNNPVPHASEMGCSLGLIPLWDLGNHQFGEMTTDYDTEGRLLRFHAMTDVAEGEQIFFHYGNRSNADLLLYAGFAVAPNPFDCFPVRLGVSARDPLCTQRQSLLELLGLEDTKTFHLVDDAEPLPQPMVAFARIFVMAEDELTRLAVTCSDLAQLSAAVLRPELGDGGVDGVDVEERAARFLHTRLQLLAAGLGGDRTETKDSAVAPFIRVVVEGEAAILRKAVAKIAERLAVIAAAKPKPTEEAKEGRRAAPAGADDLKSTTERGDE